MGIRYYFKNSEGDIKLSGLLAQACVELGFWNTRDPELILSWEEVESVISYMLKRYSNSTSLLCRFKLGVLLIWLATHDDNDVISFS